MPLALPTNVPIATLQNFLRDKVIDPTMRKSAVLGRLKAKNRIQYNKTGLSACTWPIRYYKRDITEINGAVTSIDFPYVSEEDQASLPWSEYRLGESIPKLVQLINKPGPTQIFDLIEGRMKKITEDFTEGYRLRLWQDGAKTQAGLYGFLSLFGGSSTPSYYSSGKPIYNQFSPSSFTAITSGQTGAGSGLTNSPGGYWWTMEPNATYAGVSTVLGNRDNNWTGATNEGFPNGIYSAAFNYNSPIIGDYNSKYFIPNPSLWPGSSVTSTSAYPVHGFDAQWQQATNFLILAMNTLHSSPINDLVMPFDLLARAQNSIIGSQRFEVVNAKENADYGIKELAYNGTTFLSEYGVPSGCVFAINWEKCNLWSMQKDLIANVKDNDITTMEDLMAFDAFSQLWCDAASYFGLLAGFATAGT